MAGAVELHVVIARGADAPVLDAARKRPLTMETAPQPAPQAGSAAQWPATTAQQAWCHTKAGAGVRPVDQTSKQVNG